MRRNNYAAARLQGLEDDLNLTSERYQAGQFAPHIMTVGSH